MKTNENADMFRSVLKTLKQEARKGYKRSPEECLDILEKIIPLCGPFSRGKRVCREVGLWLLRGHTEIVAPVCPDYSHENGKYNFRTLNSGVPLLGEIHIQFLHDIVAHIPGSSVTFLVADHERDDPLLCLKVGKTKEEFGELVRGSVSNLRRAVEPFAWRAEAMTDVIIDLVQQEITCADWIEKNPSFQDRVRSETHQREDMYARITSRMSYEEMTRRTIHTAAQYVAMGRFAKLNGKLICNHTTTNLAWYLQAETAFLHNPVSVY